MAALWISCGLAHAQDVATPAKDSNLETIEVEGSRAELRKEIRSRWKPRTGATRSAESLPVRTWHNMHIESSTNRPKGLTEWDQAFLRGLYRINFTPKQQRSAIATKMVGELAPR